MVNKGFFAKFLLNRFQWIKLVIVILGAGLLLALGWYIVFKPGNKQASFAGKSSLLDNPLVQAEEAAFKEIYSLMYSNPDSARMMVHQRINSIHPDLKEVYEMIYYNILGSTYLFQSEYSQALNAFHRTLEFALKRNSYMHIGNAYNNIAVVNILLGNYKDALDFLQRAKQTYEIIDSKKFIASALNNIGRIYLDINDLETAINYFRQAFAGFEEVKDSIGLSSVSSHLAQYFTSIEQSDSAHLYFLKAVDFGLQTGNNFGLSTIYQEMANLILLEGRYDEALDNFQKSDSIAKVIKSRSAEFTALLGISQVYLETGKPDVALSYLNAAMDIALEKKIKKQEVKALRLLARIYEKKGNTRLALNYLKQAEQFKKELDRHSEHAQVYNLEIQRLIESMASKEREIEKEKLISDRRKTIVYGLFILLFFTIVILSMVYYIVLSRVKQKQKDKENEIRIRHSVEKTQAVMNAEINERKRLSEELHDGIGPLLSLSKLNISNILEKDEITESKKKLILHTTQNNIDEVLKELKNIANNMSPKILTEKGLAEAFKDLSLKLAHLRRFEVSLSINGLNGPFKPYVEHALYRTFQEVLNNVVRHSDCTELNIQVLQDKKELTLMIEDNGKGFNPANLNGSNGMGLVNANNRIESLGGQFLIDSMSGRGTIITLIIPDGVL